MAIDCVIVSEYRKYHGAEKRFTKIIPPWPPNGRHVWNPQLDGRPKKKLKELRTPHAKEVLPLRNLLAEKKAHLKTLQTAEKADLNAINSTIDEMTQLQSQLMKKNAAHTQAIRKILTDDQRIAFDMRTSSGRKFHQYRRMSSEHSRRG